MKTIFNLLYSLVWICAIPLLKNHKRLKHGFDERCLKVAYNKENLEGKKITLIYASSGGEALLAQNFIKKYAQKNEVFFCFSWTKEGVDVFKKFAQKNADIYDIRTYFTPLDKPSIIYKAIKNIQPSHCYIIETEVWFGLLNALCRLNIPYSFVNARMTQKSLDGLSKMSWLLKNYQPYEVRALSQIDLDRFAQLFKIQASSKKLIVEENLKFESARDLLLGAQAILNNDKRTASAKARVLFASVRNEEQEQVLVCIEEIRKMYPNITIIICPKHLSGANFWEEQAKVNPLLDGESRFLFASKEIVSPNDISNYEKQGKTFFVWDVFGQLKQLYGVADIIFVGGSLLPLGGQNFLEPISYGIVPYIGKYTENFHWVFEKEPNLKSIGLVCEVENKEALAKEIIEEIEKFNRENFEAIRMQNQERFKEWLG